MQQKKIIYVLCFLATSIWLFSCKKEVTKGEAIKYYINIQFRIFDPIMSDLDKQRNDIKQFQNEVVFHSSFQANEDTVNVLLKTQKELISKLNESIQKIEAIESLGDYTEYKERLTSYMKSRLVFEKEIMTEYLELFRDGLNPEDNEWFNGKTEKLIELQEMEKELPLIQSSFLEEFKISNSDIEENL